MECTCSHAIAAPLRIVSSSHISGPQHSELLWSLFSLTYLSIPAEKFANRDIFFVHLQMISSNYIKCNVMVLKKNGDEKRVWGVSSGSSNAEVDTGY